MKDIIKFVDGGVSLDVSVSPDEETVWLNSDQMAVLFERDRSVIQKHIRSVYESKELDKAGTCAKNAQVAPNGKTYWIPFYNLDVVLSIGYRVNSKRGVAFRKWSTSILRDYLVKGYAKNEKRLATLKRTIQVQNAVIGSLSDKAGLNSDDVLSVLTAYEDALGILDGYDHGTIQKPKEAVSSKVAYFSYNEAKKIISKSSFALRQDLFGKEKEEGRLDGILKQIQQNVYGKEIYPSIEEKAANLLYFVDKDHVFADGNKRIAAILFIEFLRINSALCREDGSLRISNDALAALTLLIAESDPKEKDVMIAITMQCLLKPNY
jgi:Virulence protein